MVDIIELDGDGNENLDWMSPVREKDEDVIDVSADSRSSIMDNSSSDPSSDSDSDSSSSGSNDDNESNSDSSDGNDSCAGSAIVSQHGNVNLTVQKGVSFSHASSLFFASIAKGNDDRDSGGDRHDNSNSVRSRQRRQKEVTSTNISHLKGNMKMRNPYRQSPKTPSTLLPVSIPSPTTLSVSDESTRLTNGTIVNPYKKTSNMSNYSHSYRTHAAKNAAMKKKSRVDMCTSNTNPVQLNANELQSTIDYCNRAGHCDYTTPTVLLSPTASIQSSSLPSLPSLLLPASTCMTSHHRGGVKNPYKLLNSKDTSKNINPTRSAVDAVSKIASSNVMDDTFSILLSPVPSNSLPSSPMNGDTCRKSVVERSDLRRSSVSSSSTNKGEQSLKDSEGTMSTNRGNEAIGESDDNFVHRDLDLNGTQKENNLSENNPKSAEEDSRTLEEISSSESKLLANSSPHKVKQNAPHQQWQKEAPLIDPSFYKPPPYRAKAEPFIHNLNPQNRPIPERRMIPVTDMFPLCHIPMANLWKNEFHSFNNMQSELAQVLVHSDDNVVVSAPTGAGKTCVFEMAMGRLFVNDCSRSIGNGATSTCQAIPNDRKIVYISPSKALLSQRFADWTKRLADVDPTIECVVVTGDASVSSHTKSFQSVASAHIILTTPEKWDSMTRKWTDHLYLIGSVKLLLMDEVHLLGDESRGGCLEAIICRMKTVQRAAIAKKRGQESSKLVNSKEHIYDSRNNGSIIEALGTNMRFVAVSATLPNIGDIANFIDAHEAYNFDSSYRPVPLETHVVGLGDIGKNQFLFDKSLDKHVLDLLRRFSNNKPSIIFCHTKKQTETLASHLCSAYGDSSNNSTRLNMSKRTNLSSLQQCLKKGIAFHHAGMESDNRHLVEEMFTMGLIRCLCATSTLAMGVNLPAHLVMIKGTTVWRGAGQGYKDIDSGTLLQMMGRAGRPGFDTSGTAVIMTDRKSKRNYERMSDGLDIVESQLLKNLIETLNTEISQCVIKNVQEAIDWLKGTFFFLRVRKNPRHYGLFGKSEQELETYLLQQCTDSLQNLHINKLIELGDQGKSIVPRKASHVMSRHMVAFDGMKVIVSLPHDAGQLQILKMLSEFEGIHFPVRRAEKTHLNNAHKMVKHKLQGGPPSKIRVQTSSQKTFIMLQSAIGQQYLEDYTLRQEMNLSVEYASRMLSAAEDFSIEESKHGKVALECLLMRRCLATSLWGSSDGVLNQLRGVGLKTTAKLTMNNIRSFADIISKSSNEIEQACGRKSPFGQELKKAAKKIAQRSLRLSAYIEGMESEENSNVLVCEVSHNSVGENGESNESASGILTYTLVVHTDRPGGLLMFRSGIMGPSCHRIESPEKFGRIYIRLVSNLVGMDESLTLDGNDTIQKSSFYLTPVKSSQSSAKKKSGSKKKIDDTPSILKYSANFSGIDDLRIGKKRKGKSQNTKSISNIEKRNKKSRLFVTPSPHPKTNNSPPSRSTSTSALTHGGIQKLHYPKKAIDRLSTIASKEQTSMHGRSTNRNSWRKQKKEQKQFQQRAFSSSKENPFVAFKFDPNDCERQLEQQSSQLSNARIDPKPTTVMPPSIRSNTIETPRMAHAQRRSRFFGMTRSDYKNPGKSKVTTSVTSICKAPTQFVGSARRNRSVTSHLYAPSTQDLLREKAEEQRALAQERYDIAMNQDFMSSNNNYTHRRMNSRVYDLAHEETPQGICLVDFAQSPMIQYNMRSQNQTISNDHHQPSTSPGQSLWENPQFSTHQNIRRDCNSNIGGRSFEIETEQNPFHATSNFEMSENHEAIDDFNFPSNDFQQNLINNNYATLVGREGQQLNDPRDVQHLDNQHDYQSRAFDQQTQFCQQQNQMDEQNPYCDNTPEEKR
eukprot:CAMPEP_0194110528 /NCGR_PEP_ID=MMETSP0150-20130528/9767_1 /TAXON_ID=122233 /ORGANISM="Chaetoceros debilis, Strain MM31A-1" /LENGTH=1867 /DNA_ID=CAMNT_0038799741 /DNA_START=175 /DNA_END=5775 /DNA_ORIENTATION=-